VKDYYETLPQQELESNLGVSSEQQFSASQASMLCSQRGLEGLSNATVMV